MLNPFVSCAGKSQHPVSCMGCLEFLVDINHQFIYHQIAILATGKDHNCE